MRPNASIIFITLLIIFSSCEKEPFVRSGFDSQFEKNSKGISVFSLHSSAPFSFDISKTFRTKSGNWKLQYTSFNGVGVSDLHLDLIQ